MCLWHFTGAFEASLCFQTEVLINLSQFSTFRWSTLIVYMGRDLYRNTVVILSSSPCFWGWVDFWMSWLFPFFLKLACSEWSYYFRSIFRYFSWLVLLADVVSGRPWSVGDIKPFMWGQLVENMVCHRNTLLLFSLKFFSLTTLSWRRSVLMIFSQEKVLYKRRF